MSLIISRWGANNGGSPSGFSEIYPTEPVANSNPKNMYEVKINVMYGDADFYEDLKFQFTVNEERELLSFLTFLKQKVAPAYSNGRGGDDRYSSVVEGWNDWFGYDEETEKSGKFADGWPANWGIGGEATLENVDVTYFSTEGVQHSVAVE